MESLSTIWNDFGKQEADWESTFTRCAENLDGHEFKISMLPPVTMEEVVIVVSKFIELNAALEDKDAFP